MLPALGEALVGQEEPPSSRQAEIRVVTRMALCMCVCVCVCMCVCVCVWVQGPHCPREPGGHYSLSPRASSRHTKMGTSSLATLPAWDAGSSWAPSSSPCPPSPPSVREGWGRGGMVLGRVALPERPGPATFGGITRTSSTVRQSSLDTAWEQNLRLTEDLLNRLLPSTQVPGRFVKSCSGDFC